MKQWLSNRLSLVAVEVSARTAVVAGISFFVARLFRLPEAYWAPITTLVITQFSLGGALVDSRDRFFGTLIGAIIGAVMATYVGPTGIAFVGGVFVVGLICALLKLNRPSYRFGTITIAIVVLVKRAGGTESSPWIIGLHRWIEVSVGGAVALVMAWIWPDPREPTAGANKEAEQSQMNDEKQEGSTSTRLN
jgi:uncharacterized membrane protein YgaE (UPF0421/DUF939 family)